MIDFIMLILKKLHIIPANFLDVTLPICRARAIMEADRLGIFQLLESEKSGLTGPELAERITISLEGANELLYALEQMGYLKRRRDRYFNSSCTTKWFADEETGMSPFIKLDQYLWERLTHLEIPLKTGRPAKDYQGEAANDPKLQELYTRAMEATAKTWVPWFVRAAKIPAGARTLLDIGGAHGAYSAALVRKFPGLKATVLDLPGAIAQARGMLRDSGNPEGIELVEGDVFTTDLGTDWNVVLLSNMVHLFDTAKNRLLLSRIHGALSNGGLLLIMDQFHGISRFADSATSLMSFAYFTVGGKIYHRDEFNDLLVETGFSLIKLRAFSPGLVSCLFEAYK